MTSTAAGLTSATTNRRPICRATTAVVPLPAKKSSTRHPDASTAPRLDAGCLPAFGSDSPSSRCRSWGRSCATRRRSAACPARLLGAHEPGRHVRDALDLLLIEEVLLHVLHVYEDRVVLRGPAIFCAPAVVVRPDDLVQEVVATEDLVEQHLAVMRFSVVDVEVERSVVREQTSRLFQLRPDERQVVVVHVEVLHATDLGRHVTPPLKPNTIAAAFSPIGTQRRANLRFAGIERRVDIDQLERLVGQLGKQVRAVGQHDVVVAGREVEHSCNVTSPRRTRRGSSTTGTAASAGSPRASPPTPPDGRAR